MNYYSQLVREIGKSMASHPRGTILMDYGSHKVIAKGANAKKLRQKARNPASVDKISIVLQSPKENATWILTQI